jgi:hypothetical protein
VICYDVLQYLKPAQARQAIANLARVCRGALYFGALPLEDWRDNCDQGRTDRIGRRTAGTGASSANSAFSAAGSGSGAARRDAGSLDAA